MRILLVEDDRDVAEYLRRDLEEEGYAVSVCHDGADGLRAAETTAFDLVVLDVMLPFLDGLEVTRRLRRLHVTTPVLLLTALDAPEEVVRGLDAGADDYLTKPFSIGELLARVRALLRRGRRSPESEAAEVAFGDVTVDFSRRQVLRRGEPVKLTPIEYRLLGHLIANAGKVVTHRQLLREVWGTASGDNSHYLRIYVGHLRHKLEDDPAQPRHFLTETGVGYRFQL
jgi:two-component system KDP operon response regulator KdpE